MKCKAVVSGGRKTCRRYAIGRLHRVINDDVNMFEIRLTHPVCGEHYVRRPLFFRGHEDQAIPTTTVWLWL